MGDNQAAAPRVWSCVSPSRRIDSLPSLPAGAGECHRWGCLHGGAASLVLAEAARRHEAPLLFINAGPLQAERSLEELRFFLGADTRHSLRIFPDRETLPYERFSPNPDLVSERLAVLDGLAQSRRGILLTPISTLMHRLPPRDYIAAYSLSLHCGQRLDAQALRARLLSCGYRVVSQVMERGELAQRGSLVDVFPMGADHPCRIELCDEVIETLRLFDTESQRTLRRVQSFRLLPASETPLDDVHRARFQSAWPSFFTDDPEFSALYRNVCSGEAPGGIEYYLPLFHESTCSLLDYLPEDSLVVIEESAWSEAEAFEQQVQQRYQQLARQETDPLLPPEQLFFSPQQLCAGLQRFARAEMYTGRQETGKQAWNFDSQVPLQLPVQRRGEQAPSPLGCFLREFSGRVLLSVESEGIAQTLLEMLGRERWQPRRYSRWQDFLVDEAALGLAVAPLDRGLHLAGAGIVLLSEPQLFGERVRQRRRRGRRRRSPEEIIRDLTELSVGLPVVHERYGVGRYRGLVCLESNGVPGEFLLIEYAESDRLYVPVTALEQISRYTGSAPEQAPWHRLGGKHWERARRRAARQVRDTAAELLELQARRAVRKVDPCTLYADRYQRFCQGFRFEETPGQQEAIQAVLDDLCAPRPMDRLVCGDSGFGKTEVAMRAAFVTVDSDRQVMLLAPTTLLVQQHFRNFQDRFAEWPVRIACLSRFRAGRERERVLQDLESGRIDIVIGTHALLQRAVHFQRLGLAIIDEEHRFGVRQKERLKELRAQVDTLALTATPIPRTLSMAFSGLRDLSVISTPPARRLPVRSFIHEWDDELLREALARELRRGGQVYFVHNRVRSIEEAAQRLRRLLPDVEMRVAHGQMNEAELERIMTDFYHRRFHLLICTTIIENGIDLPNANTIIIDRADRFGLAQLYQLRGRVGRSHHHAYAYLLIPPRKVLKQEALSRLEAIESLDTLGIGFTLATHDLEIRGAGNLLGEEQSGHVEQIGYGLYMDMLRRAVEDLRCGRQPELDRPLDHGVEIDLSLPLLLPPDYVSDVHARLVLYKRISCADGATALTELREELIDRFGALPPPAADLLRVSELKQKAVRLGLRRAVVNERGGLLYFSSSTPLDPGRVLHLVQEQPQTYRLLSGDRLRICVENCRPPDRIRLLSGVMDALLTRDAA